MSDLKVIVEGYIGSPVKQESPGLLAGGVSLDRKQRGSTQTRKAEQRQDKDGPFSLSLLLGKKGEYFHLTENKGLDMIHLTVLGSFSFNPAAVVYSRPKKG